MENAALHVLKKLQHQGHEAYFVGGCVRDMLLKRSVKDYDIATSAKAEQVMTLFPKTIPVGVQFGVVRVLYQGHEIEVATFREDGPYLDGRRPTSIQFSNAKADVLRRDFTINGLLYNPITKEVLDYVDGKTDISQKILRTIGNPTERFTEDKLRLLRAVRISCQLHFQIEPQTWAVICQMAPQIQKVSRERIVEELTRLFSFPHPLRAFHLLRESKLLHAIFEKNTPSEPDLDFVEKLFAASEKNTMEIAFACLFYSFRSQSTWNALKKSKIFQLLDQQKFKHEICKKVAFLVHFQPEFETLLEAPLALFKRAVREPLFSSALELYQLTLKAQEKTQTRVEQIQERLRLVKSNLHPEPLFTGEDLIRLGYPSGPLFQKILGQLEEEQLEEKLQTQEQALDWLKTQYPLQS